MHMAMSLMTGLVLVLAMLVLMSNLVLVQVVMSNLVLVLSMLVLTCLVSHAEAQTFWM
jgi:hypothetical protein